MKKIKILISFILITSLAGCFKDKGEYNRSKWSGIASIEKLELSGDGVVFEGDELVINPVFTYDNGYSVSDYSFEWYIGGKKINSTQNLNWVVQEVENVNSSGRAEIYLSVKSLKSGEDWKFYPAGNVGQPITLAVTLSDIPQIGAVVYEKSNGEIEWASIKGTKQNFRDKNYSKLELKSELYKKYNSGSTLKGKVVGATFGTNDMIIYSDNKTDGGALIRIVENKNAISYAPFAKSWSSVAQEVYSGGTPTMGVASKVVNFYNILQEVLIGNEFFISPASSSYPYIKINPTSVGVVTAVKQFVHPSPARNYGYFGLLHYTNGDIKLYKYGTTGVLTLSATALMEGVSALRSDEILGVFSQAPIVDTWTTMDFFVVGRSGTAYKLYYYTISSSATTVAATYKSTTDITLWGGGMSDKSIWFGTACGTSGVVLNPAFVANGSKLYRLNYKNISAEPTLIASFDDEIVLAEPVSNELTDATIVGQLYTALFTYNATKGKSSLYFLNSHTGETLKEFKDAIDGKVVRYLPNMITK